METSTPTPAAATTRSRDTSDLLNSVSQLHRPGETLSYCNAGFNLAGHLVARIAGTTWEQALKDLLLEPGGLDDTVTFAEEAILRRVAIGHLPDSHGLRQTTTWAVPRGSAPSAAIATSIDDLLGFAQLHLADGMSPSGRRVLPEHLAREMQTEQVSVPAVGAGVNSWGLGWWRTDWGGTPVLGHDGASSGQRAFLRLLPTAGVAVAVLTNGGGGNALSREVMARLVEIATGLEIPSAFTPTPAEYGDGHSELVGTYRRDSEIIEVSLAPDGSLRMRATWVGALLDGEDDEDDLTEDFELEPAHQHDATMAPPVLVLAARSPSSGGTIPGPAESVTFYRLPDGRQVLHFRMRASLRIEEDRLFSGTNLTA